MPVLGTSTRKAAQMLKNVLVLAALAILAAPSALASNGNRPKNGPLSPAAARAAAFAPGGLGSLTVRAVTPEEVQAAAAAPGASTLGTVPAVAPDGYSPGALPMEGQSVVFANGLWGCASV